MSTTPPVPQEPYILPVGIEKKDGYVNIADCDAVLHSFLISAGLVHLHLFDSPAVVTSGKDSTHGTGSKHYIGEAVDLRVSDLQPSWQDRWLMALLVLCDRYHLTLFDERNLPGEPHLHIEIAG